MLTEDSSSRVFGTFLQSYDPYFSPLYHLHQVKPDVGLPMCLGTARNDFVDALPLLVSMVDQRKVRFDYHADPGIL